MREAIRDAPYMIFPGETGIDYNFIRGWIYFSLRDFEKSVEYLEAVRGENEVLAN